MYLVKKNLLFIIFYVKILENIIKIVNLFKGFMRTDKIKFMIEQDIKQVDELTYFEIDLCQGIGAAAEPIVKVGEKLVCGQKIALAMTDLLGVDYSSPVCGEVVEIKQKPIGECGEMKSICIKKDKSKNDSFSYGELKSFDKMSIRERLKECGVIGFGGAGFPAYAKIKPNVKYNHLLINVCSSGYYSCSDCAFLLQNITLVKDAIKYLSKILEIENVTIVSNKFMKKYLNLYDFENVKISYMPNFAQFGDEYRICKRLFKMNKKKTYPSLKGILVYNIQTICAMYKALKFGEPCTSRVITLYGDALKNNLNLRLNYGSKLQDIIDVSGGEVCSYAFYKSREDEAIERYKEILKMKEEYKQDKSPEFVQKFVRKRKESNAFIFDFLMFEKKNKRFFKKSVVQGSRRFASKINEELFALHLDTYCIGVLTNFQSRHIP